MKNTEHGFPSPKCEPASDSKSVRQATQGRWLIARLKRRAHTYMEMLSYQRSTSPWRRVAECLGADERLIKGQRNGLTTWRVVKA